MATKEEIEAVADAINKSTLMRRNHVDAAQAAIEAYEKVREEAGLRTYKYDPRPNDLEELSAHDQWELETHGTDWPLDADPCGCEVCDCDEPADTQPETDKWKFEDQWWVEDRVACPRVGDVVLGANGEDEVWRAARPRASARIILKPILKSDK